MSVAWAGVTTLAGRLTTDCISRKARSRASASSWFSAAKASPVAMRRSGSQARVRTTAARGDEAAQSARTLRNTGNWSAAGPIARM